MSSTPENTDPYLYPGTKVLKNLRGPHRSGATSNGAENREIAGLAGKQREGLSDRKIN